jgi:outer membrane lipoprotein-sorting protein
METAVSTPGGDTGVLTGPVADLFRRSGDAMKGVTSYHVTMLTEAAGQTITAEGDVMPPDRTRMTMDLGPVGKSEIIVIGDTSYVKAPGQDAYVSTTSAAAQTNTDATAALAFATSADIVGDETVDGVETTHARFTYDAAKQMESQGLATPTTDLGLIDAEIWVAKDTGYVHKFVTKTSQPVASTTTLTFSKFNEPVSPPIEKPANVTEMPVP